MGRPNSYVCDYECLVLLPSEDNHGSFERMGIIEFDGPDSDRPVLQAGQLLNFFKSVKGYRQSKRTVHEYDTDLDYRPILEEQFRKDDVPRHLYEEKSEEFLYTITLVL